MVRAGQEGGELPQSLTVVSDQMERMYDLKKKIRGALIYPSIVLIAIVGIGILMMIEVVPTLAQTFRDMKATLPVPTQIIIAVSDFLVHYTALALGLIFVFVAAIYWGGRTKIGSRVSDFVFLHLPLIGVLVREVNAARTARTLSSLLASGVDVVTSLDITAEVVQNSYFREVIKSSGLRCCCGYRTFCRIHPSRRPISDICRRNDGSRRRNGENERHVAATCRVL